MMTKPHARSVFAVVFIFLLGLAALAGIQPGGSESVSSFEKQAVSVAYFNWQHTDLSTVAFTAYGPASANYTWSFDDGSGGYGKAVTHTFQPGTYTVTLTTDQRDGDPSSNARTISISSDPPIADFTWAPETPTTQTEVQFWEASIYPPGEPKTGAWNWTWDFDDGDTAYGPSINHTFTNNGIYDVTLTLRHENDSYPPDSVTKQVFVFNVPPTAQFYWTRDNGAIHFDATHSKDIDGSVVNYTWNFDDGNVSYVQNPNHVYAENKTYHVTLTVTDDDGETATITKGVDTTNYLPDVEAFIHPVEATIRTDVAFNDSSIDLDGTIVNRTWNFGDGTTSHEHNTTHRYSAKGPYTVTLTVIDNDHAYNTTTRQVDVVNLPPDVFVSWDPVYPAVNESVTFYNYSIGPGNVQHNTTDLDGYITNQTWAIDNETVGYGSNVTHMFSKDGIHTVTLTVRDDSEDTNRSTRQVHVADIYVDDDQSPDWYDHSHVRTIQEGVNNAGTGNLIHVLEGTYPENVIVNTTVTIAGQEATVDGTGSTAFTVTADGITLHKLTVLNTSQAIVVTADNVTINGCTLDTTAGGVLIQGDHARISSNTFMQDYGAGAAVRIEASHSYIGYNTFMQTPDGVAIVNGMNHTIEANSFREAIHALQVKDAQDSHVIGNTFRDNVVAVDIINQGCRIADNALHDNDKAILLRAAGTMVVNNILAGNTVGIEITGTENTVSRTTITASTEAAIHLSSSSGTEVTDCILAGNTVGIDARGSEQPAEATIYNVTFSATTNDAVALHGAAATISSCTFSSVNRGVFINQSDDVDVTMQACTFDGCTTGIYILEAAPLVEGCDISGCDSGIISYGRQAVIADARIHNNTVGLQLKGHNTIVTDCLIRDNGYGASAVGARNLTFTATVNHNERGMLIDGGMNMSIEDALFANNTCSIALENTHLVSIHRCSLMDSDTALSLIDTENCRLEDSDLRRNVLAVTVLTSSGNTFDGNNLSSNHQAFVFSRAPGNVLRDNSMMDNDYAIDLEGSTVTHYRQNMDGSNEVNGHPVHFVMDAPDDASDVTVGSTYGYLGFVSCDNVTVTGAAAEPNGEGLLLVDVHGFSVDDGTFTHSRDGAVLFSSSHGTIASTNCSDNADDGIIMTSGTHNISITACTISGNGQRGINLYRSTGGAGNVHVSDSHIMDNWLGVNIENTRSNTIENLTFSGNQDLAFRAYKSDDTYIGNVTLHDNAAGMEITRSDAVLHNVTAHHHGVAVSVTDGTAVIHGGTMHDNDVGIAATRSSVTLSGIALHDHATAIMTDNATLSIDTSRFEHNEHGLHAAFSTVSVDGCTVANNTHGILLDHGEATIVNCTGESHIANNTHGIAINDCTDVAIVNCSLLGNENAVTVTASNETSIEDCLAFNNTDAISLLWTNDTSISGSLLHHNVHALDIRANNTTVTGCSFWKNMYGIRILDGRQNHIYHNNFAYNMQQASDAGVGTSWDDGYPAGGNYWSNYAGTDKRKGPAQNQSGSDGIGDIPLSVPAGAADGYPLMSPAVDAAAIPNSPPEAAFLIYPSGPLSNDEVDFIDQSTDPNGNSDIVAWQWHFGDGNTSTLQHPSHMYEHPGNYTVTLTVTDSHGRNSTRAKNITVSNTPPEAHFTMAPMQPAAGDTITFTDDSEDDNGDVVSWSWAFGDGSTSSQQNPSHQYSSSGTYTVTLTVTDDDGDTDTSTATVTVSGTDPTAAFSVSPVEPKAESLVSFTDLSTDDGTIATWHWDFGDGNASAAQNPTHEYEKAGTYTVTLTVWDDDGAKATTTRTVTVTGDNDTPGFMLPLMLLALAGACIAMLRKRGKL